MYSTPSWLSILIETTNQQESPTVYKLVSISKQEGEFLYCSLRNKKFNEIGSKISNHKTSITCFNFKQLSSHAIWLARPAVQPLVTMNKSGSHTETLKSTNQIAQKRLYYLPM